LGANSIGAREDFAMQWYVVEFCKLIGVTDTAAVQVAVGIVAAAPILFVAYLIVVIALYIVASMR
jgi:hypothetical protein